MVPTCLNFGTEHSWVHNKQVSAAPNLSATGYEALMARLNSSGTSLSTPIVASMITMINQQRRVRI
jgi:subtilase family serine protease